MPYALTTLYAPGTLVAGYRRGDEISDYVIQNWHLTEGEEWAAAMPRESDEAPATPLTRPTEESSRGDWEAWAVAHGMSEEDASVAPQEDLEAYEDEPADDAPAAAAERPAESARKSDWVVYVAQHPQAGDADRAWAHEDSTTKADLVAWEPAGDPVAVAANDAIKQG